VAVIVLVPSSNAKINEKSTRGNRWRGHRKSTGGGRGHRKSMGGWGIGKQRRQEQVKIIRGESIGKTKNHNRNQRRCIEQPTKTTSQKNVNQSEAKQSPRGPPIKHVKISVFLLRGVLTEGIRPKKF
jgi:hypothetical protein